MICTEFVDFKLSSNLGSLVPLVKCGRRQLTVPGDVRQQQKDSTDEEQEEGTCLLQLVGTASFLRSRCSSHNDDHTVFTFHLNELYDV